MPHQHSDVLLLLISRSESTGRKVVQAVILIETAASKCSSGSSESILPGKKNVHHFEGLACLLYSIVFSQQLVLVRRDII